MTTLSLAHGLDFHDLHDRAGLERLDARFRDHLRERDAGLADRLDTARADPDALAAGDASELLIDLAPHLEDFLAELFGIRSEVADLAGRHHALAPLYQCKRLFVQRQAAKAHKAAEAATFDSAALTAALAERGVDVGDELAFARTVTGWMDAADAHRDDLDQAARYAAWAALTPAGQARHGDGVLFKVPGRRDPRHLVPCETVRDHDIDLLALGHTREREAFHLTDPGTDLRGALDQTNYCIWCHKQGKDSCSHGLRDRKTGAIQNGPFGNPLAGCPLDEKISEMHWLKSQGLALGALAMITVDNPLCAATGHRICNDCMKACIYQKQEPVDIPQAETRTLKDVLALPWGFEIYSLLTRWNPLKLRHFLPRPDSGRKVLVVGLGPAGYSLAHHLLNDGHAVVAVDGLKIEPLDPRLSGITATGETVAFAPVRDIDSLREDLDRRVLAGFGGVAEYGITVRWDKNFLKIIRLLLERRRHFRMIGGVRFGGTVTIDDAFAMGFDHIALCAGAGRPTLIDMPHNLARGVRQASDFLMALQLTGAARTDSLANLQIELPVVVIGGGLTAIDTATEALAYYPRQVEKYLDRYETLVAERGAEAVRAAWTPEETRIAETFLTHARAIRAERAQAAAEGRAPRISELVRQWGGAVVAYRRRLVDAPSYTLNHEEVEKAMEEGVRFAELLAPEAVETDEFGHAAALRLRRQAVDPDTGRLAATDEMITLPARAVLVAAGTQPNTVLAREEPGLVELDGRYFQAVDEEGQPVTPERGNAKPAETHVLMSPRPDGRFLSFFGDMHPSFAGNVVKALASTRRGWPVVSRVLARRPATDIAPDDLIRTVDREWRATVREVKRLTDGIVEIVLHAPAAARAFRPGQFYRLQNFETLAARVDNTVLAMEGLALTGAWVDADQGLVATIVLEMGGSSDLCSLLKPGEPVILMGPTGTPTEIPQGETVLLAGGGLGNAVLFSIGQAMRANGCKVLYFAGYKSMADRYHVENIEAAADLIVWCSDQGPGFKPARPQDRAFVGNIVDAMVAYARGDLGPPKIPLSEVDRVIAIGSDRMMSAVGQARHDVLKPFLTRPHEAIGSINSPMQCMMKEICAQCLQAQRDPETGEETVVFSCFNQDQPLDRVDFAMLNDRLHQNAVHERLTAQWLDRCLHRLGLREG